MAYKANMKANYDRRHRVQEAGDLSPGARVWLPDLRTEGETVGKAYGPRSYVISTPSGLVRRNRCMTRDAGLPPTADNSTTPRVDTSDKSPTVRVDVPDNPLSPTVNSHSDPPEAKDIEPRRSERARSAPQRLMIEM